jgi:hypothetical protein
MLKCWIYFGLTLIASIMLAAPAHAISRCTAADGSVSYVQGDCPNLNQKREGVRVWDSGKGMKIGPDEPTPESYPERKQTGEPNRSQKKQVRGPRHPCNSQSSSPIQYKFETKACEILNGPHDPDNDACRSLASGNWQFYGQMSAPKYKALMARCQATAGSINYGGSSVASQQKLIISGPLNGTKLPGRDGGMVIGGPFNGTKLPGYDGGMIIGGPLNGTRLPGLNGGMIIGGPFNGTKLPGAGGGLIVGGAFNGTNLPPHNHISVILLMYLNYIKK